MAPMPNKQQVHHSNRLQQCCHGQKHGISALQSQAIKFLQAICAETRNWNLQKSTSAHWGHVAVWFHERIKQEQKNPWKFIAPSCCWKSFTGRRDPSKAPPTHAKWSSFWDRTASKLPFMLVKACRTAERISSHWTCHKMYPTIMQSIWHVTLHTMKYELKNGMSLQQGYAETPNCECCLERKIEQGHDKEHSWAFEVSSESSFYHLPLDSCPVQSSSLTTYGRGDKPLNSQHGPISIPLRWCLEGCVCQVCCKMELATLYNQKRSAGSLIGSFNHCVARCVQPWSPPLACTHP